MLLRQHLQKDYQLMPVVMALETPCARMLQGEPQMDHGSEPPDLHFAFCQTESFMIQYHCVVRIS